jgi:hypothetical protein
MTDTTTEPLVLRVQDARGVVTLTMNRPSAFNALSEGMLDALQRELDAIAADATARVVVIKGAGRAFCAGHDLKEMRAEPSQDYYERLFAQCGRMMLSIQRLPVPVIAQVHGIATAAGCQLVAMCDLAVATTDARFAVSGVNLGLFCSTPSVALSRNVGRKAAFEMLATGVHQPMGARARQSGRRGRCAGDGGRDARGVDRRQASRGRLDGEGALLPAAGDGNRGRLPRRRAHDGVQHDGRERAGGGTGLHREALAQVVGRRAAPHRT